MFLFSDDIKIWTHPDKLAQARDSITNALAPVGLSICQSKTKVWVPSTSIVLPPAFRRFQVTELECLGACLVDDKRSSDPALPSLGGELSASLETAASRVTRFAAHAEDLINEGLPVHIAQGLLRYAAHGSTQHIITSAPVASSAVDEYDSKLRAAWDRVLGLKLPDEAWQRSQLPLREGGLASGALDGLLPKAAAAFAAAWSRAAEYVCKVTGEQSMSELLACDPVLAHQLQAAADKLTGVGLQPLRTPWNNHDVPTPFRQSKILKRVAATARSRCTSALPQMKAAQWRSSSGPGSSGFLQVPNEDRLVMDNVLFRISVARRFGGGIRLRDLNAAPPQCAHCGRNGRCTGLLDHDGHHASTCNIAGYILRRHDRLVKWIASWLREDRADSDVHLEQSLLQDPPGRMDVVFGNGDSEVWVDAAVVSPTSTSERTLQSRAKKDGHAARSEEKVKRRRYGMKVRPFVVETGGRPGPSARTFLMAFASPDAELSTEISSAWLAVSSIVQAETSLAMLTACGGSPALSSGQIMIHIP